MNKTSEFHKAKDALDELLEIIIAEAVYRSYEKEMVSVTVNLVVPKFFINALDNVIKKTGNRLSDRGLSRQTILELLFCRLSASGFKWELNQMDKNPMEEILGQLLKNCPY